VALLAISGLALALAGLATLNTVSRDPVEVAPITGPDLANLREQQDQLGQRLEALIRQLDNIRAARANPAPAPAANVEPPIQHGTLIAKIERRLAALELATERIQRNEELGELAIVTANAQERERLRNEALLNYRARAADRHALPADRLEALRILRTFPDEMGARDDQVVDSMLDVLHQSREPSMRAEILRNLKGVGSANLRENLLQFLDTETDASVRSEIVETLGAMAEDARVRAALERTQKNDSSADIRNEAREALEGKR